MINVLNCSKEETKKGEAFLSPNWEVNSQSGKEIVDVLKNLDENTVVLRVEPQKLLVTSITRRTRDGIKTITINPLEVDPEALIASGDKLEEEVMFKEDLASLSVDELALNEAFIEGHFFVSIEDDCLIIPNKGFTAMLCKKIKAGKMPAGLNVARDLYLATLMGMGDNPITIITRGEKSSGMLKAVGAFGENYPFIYQMDSYRILKKGLENIFGHMTEHAWCVTHQYTSITWAVCPCGDLTLGVCAQYSQTGYAATQLFPVAIYATGWVEKIGPGVSRPNTSAAVAADPECERLIESFAEIWKEEIAPLGEALSRAKTLTIPSLKEEVVRAAHFVAVRKELNEKKRARFMEAFEDVPDTPANLYDVLMHILEAPVLMHRLFSGTYEMVQNSASAALAFAEEREGVL